MEKGERTGRRIRLDEALLLVAALAIGATLARPCVRDMKGVPTYRANVRARVQQARYWGSLIYPWITPATYLLPILAIRRAWPDARSALRAPGTITCVAAGLALLVWGVVAVAGFAKGSNPFYQPIQAWIDVARPVGHAVTGVWITLLIVGVKGRASDGLDFIGRILGAIWCLGMLGWILTGLYLSL